MSTDVSAQKSALRKTLNVVRSEICSDLKATKQANINLRLSRLLGELADSDDSFTVASYRAFDSEVVVHHEGHRGIDFVFPRIRQDELDFYRSQNFEKNRMGIEEPSRTAELVKNDSIDFVIVPGLGFDRTGQRLGYGRGFYDRWLSKNRAVSVGIAFSEQVLGSNLPKQAFDVPMDYIVTENYCLSCVDRKNNYERVG